MSTMIMDRNIKRLITCHICGNREFYDLVVERLFSSHLWQISYSIMIEINVTAYKLLFFCHLQSYKNAICHKHDLCNFFMYIQLYIRWNEEAVVNITQKVNAIFSVILIGNWDMLFAKSQKYWIVNVMINCNPQCL